MKKGKPLLRDVILSLCKEYNHKYKNSVKSTNDIERMLP